MNPEQIGISTACFYPHVLTEDGLTIAAELGFPVVEVFLQTESEYQRDFAQVLAQRSRATGVHVHSLHLYAALFDLWAPYSRAREETRARFLRLLDVAKIVGARALTWHGLRFDIDNPALVGPFLESTIWAAEMAHAAGIMLCVENVSWCYLRRPEHVATLKTLGVPLGFTFDSFQAAESGVAPETLVAAMDGALTTVHLADYAPAGPRHLNPGAGIIDWHAVFTALNRIAYTGPLLIEVADLDAPKTLCEIRSFIADRLAEVHSGV
ncbi:MAG: sugar phosphate isomerase/epimerase [Anaerolineae bacterium]|nr:sugar phosphate isomerase/epimerase [Anaerolineae bacterium]